MMLKRLLISSLFGLGLLMQAADSLAQTRLPPDSQIYANFLGNWTGTNHYTKEGEWHDNKVNLSISLTKHGMRFDYDYVNYDNKGNEQHTHNSRDVTLSPAIDQVTLQWERSEKETYRATGLSSFAQTDLGTFSFVGIWPVYSKPDEKPTAHKCTFDLKKDELSWDWYTGASGTPYTLTSFFRLTRIAAPVSPLP